MRSAGVRYLVVAVLALLMAIPLTMVSSIIEARRGYSDDTIATVGREWGGPQVLVGPELVVPVRRSVTETLKREVVDPATGRIAVHPESGLPIMETYQQTRVEARDPVYLLPERFDARLTSQTHSRYRGIFQVPVYSADAALELRFEAAAAEAALGKGEALDWAGARLVLYLSGNRALRGAAVLTGAGGREIALEPLTGRAGIEALVGDITAGSGAFHLALGLNGAERLMIAPVGRVSLLEMTGDWPDPSFTGAFLPDSREIGPEGFSARWTIPHLARAVPQVGRAEPLDGAEQSMAFGVAFYQPNDFYQKAWRAARYGLLTVALTFLTVLLIEGRRPRPVHPVQYILIGLAQAVFVLLMLAYAEQIGFGPAYLAASAATVALLVMFGLTGLKLGRRAWVLGAMLVVLYAVLYLILRSTDFALIAGATLAFVALAATMVATRNEDWYGPAGGGLPGRRPRAGPGAAKAPPDQA